MSIVTSCVGGGLFYLLYLLACALQYRYLNNIGRCCRRHPESGQAAGNKFSTQLAMPDNHYQLP
jgi:hypothetical protein